ncbi:MAG: UDP-N-acetylglucosamine 1-carboxyvinyltransferase [Verrucomicrobiota bacterium]
MDVIRIEGGRALQGEVRVGGAKNSVLPVFAACLLTDQECVIRNVPDLSDVHFMARILEEVGARVSNEGGGVWRIQSTDVSPSAPYELVRKMRASICLLGAMVGRLGTARVSMPGGCVIGPRPIDLHIKGLRKLGCTVEVNGGYLEVDGRERAGGSVFLGGRYGSTVLGTANVLMAAVTASGETRIECAACEPEVVDLCKFLTQMGAKIEGIGGPTLTVEGVPSLSGADFTVISDRIETGTFLIAGGLLNADLKVCGSPPSMLGAFVDKMEEIGVEFSFSDGVWSVERTQTLRPVDLITLPHPGFPTDLQAQLCTLLSVTEGISVLTERVYPNRFMHVPELQRMGAHLSIEGASCIIKGVSRLSGAPVMASDLRASAALVLAGLVAKGETWIQRVYHLDRGYDRMDEKLRSVGAKIERLSANEMPKQLIGDERR